MLVGMTKYHGWRKDHHPEEILTNSEVDSVYDYVK